VAEFETKLKGGFYEISSAYCHIGSKFRCVARERADKRLLQRQTKMLQHKLLQEIAV
jgi:hypothetical protein